MVVINLVNKKTNNQINKSKIMCIIIIKEKKTKIKQEILIASSIINPHGMGVVWLDTYETEYFDSDEWERLNNSRPYIAHFRYATVGSVCKANCHPFRINDDEMLFQNGSVYNLGYEDITDAQHMAEILSTTDKSNWASILEMSDCRWVTVNTKEKTHEVYNKSSWKTHNGTMYSKANVLESKLVAVYGTLKRGQGNYNAHLSTKEFIGAGKTKNQYRMIVEGLPYLSSKKNKGGYNVNVDVFLVGKTGMYSLDRLEAHPSWYCRTEARIQMEDGSSLMAWVYFNDTVDYNNKEYVKSYERKPYTYELKSTFQEKKGKLIEPNWNVNNRDSSMFSEEEMEDMALGGESNTVLSNTYGYIEGCQMGSANCDRCGEKTFPDDLEEAFYCFGCESYKDASEVTFSDSSIPQGMMITKDEADAVLQGEYPFV